MDIRSIVSGSGQGLPVAEKSHTRAAASPGAAPVRAPSAPAAGDAAESVKAPTPQQLQEAVEHINKSMQAMSQNLEFTVDPDSQRTVVKIIDKDTKEVLRQMPTQEALEISKALDRMQGLLIRQKA